MKSTDKRSTIRMILRAAQCVVLALLLGLLALPAHAQQSAPQPPATLTLDEAIRLARQYNPQYRATANDAAAADWQLRVSYANLVPTLNVGGSLSYQMAGTERIGGFEDVARPAAYGSGYSVGGGMQISGSTFFQIAQARANRSATDSRISAAGFQLEDNVTIAYLAALRTKDQVALQEQVLKTAQEAQRLAEARYEAGDKPRLDAAQAEVASGRAEVDYVQAQNQARAARRALLQMIGVQLDRDVDLTTKLTVFEPTWTLDELVAAAMSSHPQLLAARAAAAAGKASARAASMAYLPSINIQGGVSGFTRATTDAALISQAQSSIASQKASCESNNELNSHLATPLPGYPKDCSQFVFTDADRAAATASNKLFPFNFTKTPASFSMGISLPIFDGFSREQQTEQARAAAQDANYNLRAEELNRRAMVANAFDAVETAYKTVALEERNMAVGQESLELAQGRYAAGAGNIYELMQAQTLKAQADQAHLVAVYTFHEAVALLENAVGKPLRTNAQKN